MNFCIHSCAYCHEAVSHYSTTCQGPSVVEGFHTDCPGPQPPRPPAVLSVTQERTVFWEKLQSISDEPLSNLTEWGVAREDD